MESKILFRWLLFAIAITLLHFFLFPTSALSFFVPDPSTFVIWSIASVGFTLLTSGIFHAVFGTKDVEASLPFLLGISSLEEGVFRQAAVIAIKYVLPLLVAGSADLFVTVAIIAVMQAFIFAVVQRHVHVSGFFLAIGWLIVAWYGGMIPAAIGHIVANTMVKILGAASDAEE